MNSLKIRVHLPIRTANSQQIRCLNTAKARIVERARTRIMNKLDYTYPSTRPKVPEMSQDNSFNPLPSLDNPNPLLWFPEFRPIRRKARPHNLAPEVPSKTKVCKEALKTMSQAEFKRLDPNGTRRRLFEKNKEESVNVRDIVMVRTQTGDPFAGVVLRIQRKQHDSSILLRNTINGTGIEREFKIFSPTVTAIEIVQKRKKVPKQSRLFYMRKPEHDIGSVDSLVRDYLKKKKALGTTVRLNLKPGMKK